MLLGQVCPNLKWQELPGRPDQVALVNIDNRIQLGVWDYDVGGYFFLFGGSFQPAALPSCAPPVPERKVIARPELPQLPTIHDLIDRLDKIDAEKVDKAGQETLIDKIASKAIERREEEIADAVKNYDPKKKQFAVTLIVGAIISLVGIVVKHLIEIYFVAWIWSQYKAWIIGIACAWLLLTLLFSFIGGRLGRGAK